MVELNIFMGYRVGLYSPTIISHLQFNDDALLLRVKSWDNVIAMCDVLVILEVLSGLKVNFHKSMLVEININDSWLNEVASFLNFKIGQVPFMYLGLLIGGDAQRLLFLEPMSFRIKSRLSCWRRRLWAWEEKLVGECKALLFDITMQVNILDHWH